MGMPMHLIREAERLGYDVCFCAEAYGSDAITPLAWIGAQTERIKLGTAIAQIHARTPAMMAMTAMTLDALSGGRFVLGLGPSGPQVVEGWHGVPYGKPLTRQREYVAIIREILRRERPLQLSGEYYQIPNTGPGTTGLGRPLRSILHPRADMQIYTAAISPNGVRAAAEIADGFFPVWMDPEKFELFRPSLEAGFKKAGGGKSYDTFDVAPFVSLVMGDDLDACFRAVKPMLALYIGGMGARDKNFYNDYARRLGYEEAAAKIQDLYLDGQREAAMAAVPDALVDAVALCGPAARIADRLKRFKEAPIGTLVCGSGQIDVVRLLAEHAL
jgi:F420-dependent oxidoreductase-like protein